VPNISGFPALDVAIGLIFVYFVFSLIASGVNEWLATALKWRAKGLEAGIGAMLTEPGQLNDVYHAVVGHHLVRGLGRAAAAKEPVWQRLLRKVGLAGAASPAGGTKDRTDPADVKAWKQLPSYLPSPTFSAALVDALAAGGSTTSLSEIRTKVADNATPLPPDVRSTLLRLIDHADDKVEHFRAGAEQWFDNTMDRIAGWYKRRVQLALVIISIAVAVVFNVDSFQIANTLLNDGTVRSAVLAKAHNEKNADAAAAKVDDLKSLKLPIGWVGPPQKPAAGQAAQPVDPRARPHTFRGWVGKVFGLLVTGLALSLGAPFWFDLLNRVTRLRNTGPPEGGPRERRPRPDRAPELLAARAQPTATVVVQRSQPDEEQEP
jgi:hypothetical protein